jgi:hypothetical protein
MIQLVLRSIKSALQEKINQKNMAKVVMTYLHMNIPVDIYGKLVLLHLQLYTHQGCRSLVLLIPKLNIPNQVDKQYI